MKKLLLTGATGFIGRALLKKLLAESVLTPRAAVRAIDASLPAGVDQVVVGDISAQTDWGAALAGVDFIVHAAARAHVLDETENDPLTRYRQVNVDGTLNLARQAAAANVKRLVFISSIKVNGESTPPGRPFKAEDLPNPEDAYGISKWEAEIGLKQLSDETGVEIVVIRPPLVYGPGVKANFQRMMRWVSRGIPLPLAGIENKRSLLALDNLIDLIVICIEHPSAANQILLAADGEDLSTTELLRLIGEALGSPARLFPVPSSLLSFTAALLGKQAVAERLLGSLQVDISRTCELLQWKPPVSLGQGLCKAARDFET
jgi:nucleoside-diphosphate-sugar epimerase